MGKLLERPPIEKFCRQRSWARGSYLERFFQSCRIGFYHLISKKEKKKDVGISVSTKMSGRMEIMKRSCPVSRPCKLMQPEVIRA